MRAKLTAAALAATLSVTAFVPSTAWARRHYVHQGHSHRCSGGNGAVGTVVGGVGGAVITHAVIGGPVALVAGGVGGALLGRHLDKQHTRHRAGCR